MDPRSRRSPARFLAPLALIVVLVAFLSIVTSPGSNGGGSPVTDTASQTSTHAATTTGTASKTTAKKSPQAETVGPRTYTVQVGDTLGSIADKTGIPLERIQTLNPDVDPHAMVAGQQIKLR